MSRGFPPGFQWNEEKNQANIRKHGIDFRDAVRAFENPTLDRDDNRQNYGENRINSLAHVDGRVLHLTHTTRDGETRLISARVADQSERRAYREFVHDLAAEQEPYRGQEMQPRWDDRKAVGWFPAVTRA